MTGILDGKVCIITGASGGIGLATVQTFLKAGALVLGVDMLPAPEAVPESDTFVFFQIDITEPDAAATIIAKAISSFPAQRLDVLVNVAGIIDDNGSVVTVLDSMWERIMAVNLTAPMALSREAVKIMLAQGHGGSIVNVTSKAGISGAAGGVAYSTSKHALVGLTKNTAWLFKDDKIRCNAIAPGAMATPAMARVEEERNASEAKRAAFDMETFLKIKPVYDLHFGEAIGVPPADPVVCGKAIAFLASDMAEGVSGVILPVDNAWSTI